jgi:hypothetical protein
MQSETTDISGNRYKNEFGYDITRYLERALLLAT